jgi:hypothetical protein
MSKLKLTPWFPGHVKPVRVGVYERLYDEESGGPQALRCNFDGLRWSVHLECSGDKSHVSGYQNLRWRGLASKDGK